MKTILNVCLCLSIFVVSQGQNDENDDILKSVIVIFRHGDRNIISTYPNDPYNDISFWPGGWGQLVKRGLRRHFELGKWFRSRYDGFLPENYSYYDVHVKSTDVDRTLMSVSAHLAGLFYPRGEQDWNPSLPWRPIPIHTTPEVEDAVLAMFKPCAKYNRLFQEFLVSEKMLKIQANLKETYAYINSNGGGNITTLEGLQDFYDLLFIEEQSNYTLPAWLKTIYPEKLEPYAAFFFSMASYTLDLARLKSGPLINEIITHFDNATKHEDASFQKYKIYSAHDTTLGNILTSMGAYNDLSPPYATSLILELRQKKEKHVVNLLYKNETETADPPYRLSLLGCDFDCEFSEFVKILEPVTISLDQWEKECNEKIS